MNAQTATGKVTGEYYLRGVMETASGIKLNKDSTFEFFFSQGALDRVGKGTWKKENNTVILNSRPKPATDFAMVTSKKVPGNYITIQISGLPPYLQQYMEAKITTSRGDVYGESDSKGVMRVSGTDVKEIALHFLICGERESIYKITDSKLNYFEFKPESWMPEVFCENLVLTLDEDGFVGAHPLLRGKEYSYVKSKREE